MDCQTCGSRVDGAFCGLCGAPRGGGLSLSKGGSTPSTPHPEASTPPESAHGPWSDPSANAPLEPSATGGEGKKRSVGVLIAVIAVALIAGLVGLLLVANALGSDDQPIAEVGTSTVTETATAGEPATTSAEPTVDLPWQASGDANAPRAATSAEVIRDSTHKECRSARSKVAGYPVGNCDVFRGTEGYETGVYLSKGEVAIVCQRQFPSRENPQYLSGQENTWWFWARSGQTWDWFPETAISQGGSRLPLGRIAVCQGS